MRKPRRQFTAKEKVAILRAHLLEKSPISDLCEKHGIQPTVFYRWQAQFFENGEAAFEKDGTLQENRLRQRVGALEEKLQKKNEVLSELLEEHVLLKKKIGEL